MTNTPQDTPSRLDQIEALLLQTNASLNRVAQQQETNTQAIADLTENTNRVLARSAVLDDVLLELHESHERHERNFEQHQRNVEENQRNINAALDRLEAILLQIIRKPE
ncbi:MAG: hypothetical protein KME32_33910 [Mojavia pulchra JT2-VF2]|jgi:predicted  nucleic acid-binding Zn-ribbon protein|uniref:Uncharacterized protein n=1 Tax=Mojavia pulchra JT2-VF2 TaxID=287848 RepID=A0A951Q5N1_9NOST|nr:hypothetical protein [Mojavia pulchra JT2-VF2]